MVCRLSQLYSKTKARKFTNQLNLIIPGHIHRSAKCNGEWPSLPYAGQCMLCVYAKADKLGLSIDAIGIEIHLLKVNFMV